MIPLDVFTETSEGFPAAKVGVYVKTSGHPAKTGILSQSMILGPPHLNFVGVPDVGVP